MNWVSQNWIWIALAVGAFFFMTRMGRRGMGRSMRHNQGTVQDGLSPDVEASPRTVFDPVSKHSVVGGTTISSIYRDRAYYFENRENREAFEAAPEKYVAGMASAGQEIGAGRDNDRPRHHRHGC